MTNSRPATISTLSSSPISKLCDDVLYFIFELNSYQHASFDRVYQYESQSRIIDDEAWLPLDTARATSQVSSSWRRILLNTCSFWGRLMDWRSLNQDADHWRYEVLRRSGTAPLWLERYPCSYYTYKDGTPAAKQSTFQFFSQLVETHWARIERLSAFFSPDYSIGSLATMVQCAASDLKIFVLHGEYKRKHHFRGSMFADHAPQLHIFRAFWTHCNLEASWMSNIREMSLGEHFRIEEVCKVLAHMPLLETLAVYSHAITSGYQGARIHLPNLKTFKIRDCLRYLLYIDPARECVLDLFATSIDTDIELIGSCATHASKIVHNHLACRRPEKMHLSCRPGMFMLAERRYFSFEGHHTQNDMLDMLNICIRLREGEPSNYTQLCFLESLTSPLFSTVTVLALSSYIPDPHINSAFTAFMSCFSALETLWIIRDTIAMLPQHTIDESDTLIFPNLRKLVLHRPNLSPIYWIDSLDLFLSHRHIMGAPITTVDIIPLGKVYEDMDPLKSMINKWERNGTRVVFPTLF